MKESKDLSCSNTVWYGSWLLLAEQLAFLPNQKKKDVYYSGLAPDANKLLISNTSFNFFFLKEPLINLVGKLSGVLLRTV